MVAIDNERKLLELLHLHPHANILSIHGIVVETPQLKLVMAYCPGGSLDSHLEASRQAGAVSAPRVCGGVTRVKFLPGD